MIKREKSFFDLATMFSKEERKKNFFSLIHYDHYDMIKRGKSFFHLATMFTNKEINMFCLI